MKKLVARLATLLSAILIVTAGATARIKVDKVGLADVQTVALVGYSFLRVLEMEDASPFKLKREFKELKPEDAEYVMMQNADDGVLEVLQNGGTFTVLPYSEVFESELYQSSTKDPAKKLSLNWYYPDQFRVIKLKKANAIALCEELGVDAVVQIHFKHAVSESSSKTLGILGKTKKFIALKGTVTVIDKSGKTLISGNIKSTKKMKSKKRSFGNQSDNGVQIETSNEDVDEKKFFDGLLASYLERLDEGLGFD